METTNNFLPLMILDINDIIFGIQSITVIIKCHLSGFTSDVSGFQIMKNPLTCEIKKIYYLQFITGNPCKCKINQFYVSKIHRRHTNHI